MVLLIMGECDCGRGDEQTSQRKDSPDFLQSRLLTGNIHQSRLLTVSPEQTSQMKDSPDLFAV